jgi:RNA polymerase sigma-70 factor (ECF subfamily)
LTRLAGEIGAPSSEYTTAHEAVRAAHLVLVDDLRASRRHVLQDRLGQQRQARLRAEDLLFELVDALLEVAEAHDVLLAGSRVSKTFSERRSFRPGCTPSHENLCIDQARKAVLRRHPSLDQSSRGSTDDGPTLGEVLPDKGPRADRNAISKELQSKLVQAIQELPEDQREVFMLREYGSLAFKEIADIVGAPENTVKSRMRYALERLQSALAEYEEYAKALG